jgi:hypothetical protein
MEKVWLSKARLAFAVVAVILLFGIRSPELYFGSCNQLTVTSKTDGRTQLEVSVRYFRCTCDCNVKLLGDRICFVQTDAARVGGVQPNAQSPRTPREVDNESNTMRQIGLMDSGCNMPPLCYLVTRDSVYSRKSIVALHSSL